MRQSYRTIRAVRRDLIKVAAKFTRSSEYNRESLAI
jgi:hypothetical protein